MEGARFMRDPIQDSPWPVLILKRWCQIFSCIRHKRICLSQYTSSVQTSIRPSGYERGIRLPQIFQYTRSFRITNNLELPECGAHTCFRIRLLSHTRAYRGQPLSAPNEGWIRQLDDWLPWGLWLSMIVAEGFIPRFGCWCAQIIYFHRRFLLFKIIVPQPSVLANLVNYLFLHYCLI